MRAEQVVAIRVVGAEDDAAVSVVVVVVVDSPLRHVFST